ncbi:uncharacterized protein N7458_006871 [Penicillium daleae]|uniref:GPI anchored protein n=1 Tax=Penicillium daleae TaxID=63821 RepID=A0AAD6C537_9EURO|nr:uncharacterized protein N7458_006871 [Penicillium daleae]KAJ5450422.1 hypothetical protein N7458_006871 [Penicillium daleae]
MHLTALSALVLLAPALALPQETATATMVSSNSGSSDAQSVDEANVALAEASLPSDYISVLETAVPSSWEFEMENPASEAAVLSAAANGIFPSWYNDLPASIKAVVTELGGFDADIVGATSAVTATAGPTSGAAADTTAATTASGSTGAAATQTPASGSSDAASSSKAASTSARSTGGAPIATGSIAVSVAGAAGLLGLVFAL